MTRATTFAVAASGLLVGVLGVLIRYAGWTHLVAGYDPDRVDDEAGLAGFVGGNLLVVAALLVAAAAVESATSGAADGWYWPVVVVGVVGLAVRTALGARRYESSPEDGGDA